MSLSDRLRMDLDLALALVETGMSPNNVRDHYGRPALVTSLILGDMAAMKTLLKAGADPFQDFMGHGLRISAIELAIGPVGDENPEALDVLLKHPGVLGSESLLGHALMYTAAKIGTPKTITALVEAGVDLNEPKIGGRSPIQVAMNSTKENVLRVRTMLALGAMPAEVEQVPSDYKPSLMIRQLNDAMAHGPLYNAAKTMDTGLIEHVMSRLGTNADPDDERAARRWAKSSKAKGAHEVVGLFDGFLQALKANEVIGKLAKLSSKAP